MSQLMLTKEGRNRLCFVLFNQNICLWMEEISLYGIIINHRERERIKMKTIKKCIIVLLITCLTLNGADMACGTSVVSTVSEAHSGRTDSHGGHHDYKNKSGLGSYHYHCGGHPAHLHKNGICPYSSQAKQSTSKNNDVKKVQLALNKKGYSCGQADGKMGSKTKNAIKKYQKAHHLKVTGTINTTLKKSLGVK